MKTIRLFPFLLFVFLTFGSSFHTNAQGGVKGSEDELLALQYFNAGEYDKAVVLYEKLFKKDPSVYIYGYYFDCLMALSDYKAAEKLVNGQIKKNPEVARYKLDMGLIYAQSGDPKRAEKSFDEAIKSAIPTEDNYHAIAQYFMFKSMVDWTIKTYEYAVTTIPSSLSFRMELGNLYFRNHRYEDVFEQYYILLNNPMITVELIQQRLLALMGQDSEGKMRVLFVPFALKKSQKNPSDINYSEMLLWAYIQVSDFEKALAQVIAMDKRQKANGGLVIDFIPIVIYAEEYELAMNGLNYILEKGEDEEYYDLARISMFNVMMLKATSTEITDIAMLEQLEQDIIAFLNETGVHIVTAQLVSKLANLQAYYLDKPLEAKQWLTKAMEVPRISAIMYAELKIQMADIMLLTGEHWDASLLYSQVEKDFKHDTLGYVAKFKNAQFYFYIGEFDYALTHLSVLRAATSKLIANDAMKMSLFITDNIDFDSSYVPLSYYARAEFHLLCKKPLAAIETLDSLLNIFPRHPVRDDAYFLKAKIYMQLKNYELAAASLHEILAAHYTDLLADDALFQLAVLYRDRLNKPEKAMELFWQLVSDFPSSIYTQESRDAYRKLQQDQQSIQTP